MQTLIFYNFVLVIGFVQIQSAEGAAFFCGCGKIEQSVINDKRSLSLTMAFVAAMVVEFT